MKLPADSIHNAELVLQHLGINVTKDQVVATINAFLASAKDHGLHLAREHKCCRAADAPVSIYSAPWLGFGLILNADS